MRWCSETSSAKAISSPDAHRWIRAASPLPTSDHPTAPACFTEIIVSNLDPGCGRMFRTPGLALGGSLGPPSHAVGYVLDETRPAGGGPPGDNCCGCSGCLPVGRTGTRVPAADGGGGFGPLVFRHVGRDRGL